MRVHQWSKNLLVFIPMLLAHRFSIETILQSIAAFFAMSFLASSVYLLNDLLDLSSDRVHKTKKQRPLASGELTISKAVMLIPLLLILGLSFAIWKPALCRIVGCYLLITTLYSLAFKKVPVIDVLLLSMLYMGRLLAGSMATGIVVSEWLASFAVFFFLSLALVKRASELLEKYSAEFEQNLPGRGYSKRDIPFVTTYGISCAVVSVLVLAFYIYSMQVQVLYRHPQYLWLICLLLHYWLGRIWLITMRGEMHSDPVYFALKDPQSYVMAFMTAGIGMLAL